MTCSRAREEPKPALSMMSWRDVRLSPFKKLCFCWLSFNLTLCLISRFLHASSSSISYIYAIYDICAENPHTLLRDGNWAAAQEALRIALRRSSIAPKQEQEKSWKLTPSARLQPKHKGSGHGYTHKATDLTGEPTSPCASKRNVATACS